MGVSRDVKVGSTVGSVMTSGDNSQYLEGYAFAVAELLWPDLAWGVIDYLLTHPIRDDWDRGALDAAVAIAYGRELGTGRVRFIRPRRLGLWPCPAPAHRKKTS